MVLCTVGLLAVGFLKTLSAVDQKQRGDQASERLQRAEDALYGLAMRDHRLPMPEDAGPSGLGPGHVEGWLPEHVLGTEPPRSIRYVVDRSFTQAPGAIYRADPLRLLGDEVPVRTTFNGLDLCMQVIQQEEAGLARRQGQRWALGVHRPEAGGVSTRRAAGYLEFLDRLGCAQAFGALSTALKAAVLAADLRDLARLDASLRRLAVRDAEDALRNHQWRATNAMARLAVSSWNLVATKLTGATTPLGAFKVAANVAGFTFEAARWTVLLHQSIQGAQKTAEKVAAQKRVLADAERRYLTRDAAWAAQLQRVNLLQAKGLTP